jgi:hypothetical protein
MKVNYKSFVGLCALTALLTQIAPPALAAKTLSKKQALEVQKVEIEKTKKIDKNYAKQAKSQSQYYTKLAQKLAKSGVNVQALLTAAAYFDSESKK